MMKKNCILIITLILYLILGNTATDSYPCYPKNKNCSCHVSKNQTINSFHALSKFQIEKSIKHNNCSGSNNTTNSKSTIAHNHSNNAHNHGTTKTVLTVSYVTIFMIGVPGNILVLTSIARTKQLYKTTNLFIANLAAGDLINLTCCIMLSLINLYVSWPFGEFVCKYIYPLPDVLIGNNIYILLAISLERYSAITHPMKFRQMQVKMVLLISLVVAVVSYLIIGLPLKFANQISEGFWVKKSCNLHWQSRAHKEIYRGCLITWLFFIPAPLLAFIFARMRTKLIQNIEFAKSSMNKVALQKRALVNRKIIRCHLVMNICFAICFLPINVLLVLHTYHSQFSQWPYIGIVFQISFLLLLCHSILNPIILVAMSLEFRSAIKKQIQCLAGCADVKEYPPPMSLITRSIHSTDSDEANMETIMKEECM